MLKNTVKKTIILACLCALSLPFGSDTKAEDFKWPSMLRIGVHSTQSASFASANGWAAIFGSDMGVTVRVVPEEAEIRRYTRFLVSQDFDIASFSFSDASASLEGHDGYKIHRASPIRMVWHHLDTPWGFAVRGDSPYKTIYDLKQKGVRVAVNTVSPGMSITSYGALPAFLGWTREEAEQNWTYVPTGSYPASCRSIIEGRADVTWMSPVSSITFELDAHPLGLRWLATPEDDIEGWKRFLQHRPTTMPIKLDFGVESARGVTGQTSPFIFYTRPDVDQEMIYRLTKWLHEAFDSYKDTHAVAPRMSLELWRRCLNHAPHPVAEGTIRYLREIGQWTEEDDKWNEEAIELMDRWVAARNAAIDEAESQGIRIHYQNEEYLNLLKEHTADIPVFRIRM